jgi:hypothetical protein
MTKPRVAVIGKRNHLHWDRHVANAFRRLGCEVNHHPYNSYPLDILALRTLAQIFLGKRRMRQRAVTWSVGRWARAMATFRPDLVFVTNAFFVPLEYYQQAKQLPSRPTLCAWDGDGSIKATTQAFAPLDLFFESGTDCQRRSPAATLKVETLSFAADELVYVNRRQPRENKLYFCGNWTPARDKVISALYAFPLVLKGWGWRSKLTKKGQHFEISEGTVSLTELVADYNRYRFVLNTHQAAPFMGMNMRTFEASACGACQLCDRRDGLDALFTDGREILVYDGPEAVGDRVQWAFDHPHETAQIAEGGYQRVLAQHTYLHRMRQALTAVGRQV